MEKSIKNYAKNRLSEHVLVQEVVNRFNCMLCAREEIINELAFVDAMLEELREIIKELNIEYE